MGITIPRDTLLFGRRRGVDSGGSYPHRRPHSSCPCMLVLGGGGLWADALPPPSAAADYLTGRAVNIWEDEPVWQNPLLSSTPLLNHALSPLKMCRELWNLKEGFTEGNGETTQSGELLSLILWCLRPSGSSSRRFSFSAGLTYTEQSLFRQKKVSLHNLRLGAQLKIRQWLKHCHQTSDNPVALRSQWKSRRCYRP